MAEFGFTCGSPDRFHLQTEFQITDLASTLLAMIIVTECVLGRRES